jgi:Dolichyl-phosphate-mannose-protein mannosyltransferase
MDAPARRARPVVARTLAILALVFALRLPFLHQAIQGDDVIYLTEAEHAQIEPLHPMHAREMFRGQMLDMRGHSHPPLDGWILGGLIALFGEVREVPFHLAYTVFSLVAAMSMWSLARRFSNKPLLATLLFCAVPAFVVNGNSFESDLPLLAFWMTAVALFVYAVDRESIWALAGSMLAAALAGLTAYQAIFVTPILGIYLLQHRRDWIPGWIATLAAPAMLLSWQLWERVTTGVMPAAALAGNLQSYKFESFAMKGPAAVALLVHLGWIVSPLIMMAAIRHGSRWQWIAAAIAALAAVLHDPNPLFWLSIGCGVWLLAWCVGRDFLGWWALIFFGGAVIVFFAPSARYLLPLAAPIAILAANAVGPRIAVAGLLVQLALSLGLAIVNYQHWDAYRQFAETLRQDAATRRLWINSELGFRFYLESEGGLLLGQGQPIQPGDLIVTSALANPLPVGMPTAPLSQVEIRPAIPLRLISLNGRSAYSSHSGGLLPFEISTGPIDFIRTEIAVEPTLSYLDPHDPKTKSQIVKGWFPEDGWTAGEATVLLKVPPGAKSLDLSFTVPPIAPVRQVRMAVNGRPVAEKDISGSGTFTLSVPAPAGSQTITVTISVDKTFSAPPDARDLGIIMTGVGLR